jgi:hypothetical protein
LSRGCLVFRRTSAKDFSPFPESKSPCSGSGKGGVPEGEFSETENPAPADQDSEIPF